MITPCSFALDAAQQGDEADGRLRCPQLIADPLGRPRRDVTTHYLRSLRRSCTLWHSELDRGLDENTLVIDVSVSGSFVC